MAKARNVFFLMFDDVEVLDFSGPFDVFSMSMVANRAAGGAEETYFNLRTVSQTGETVTAIHGLKIVPDYSFADCANEDIDILIIPGGMPDLMTKFPQEVIDWIRDRGRRVEVLASICVGGLILAQTGLLEGLRATTHHDFLPQLRELAPRAIIEPGIRYVDNSPKANVMMSAGVSAGMDLAFYLLAKLVGADAALNTANLMEYNGSMYWAAPAE